MNKLKMMLCVFIAGLAIYAQAQTTVNPGDDLNSIINNSSGETITVNSGTYDPLLIEYKNFSAANPLIIKAADGADVTIKPSNWDRQNPHTGSYDAAVFTECSYIAFDNIKFTGDGQAFSVNDRGVWIHNSDHMIFRNCEFTQTQQEGVKVEATSEYIDFINCLFANTGLGTSWFGEGLYVGRGSYNNNEHLFPDASKYIWVEGCEFHHTGRGEAINIKAEVFHCTIRDNYIHDITLNDNNSSQTNEGAISLDHTAGLGDNYRVGERREIWVENNTIEKVRSGKSGQRIAGIYSAGTGNNIVGNTVTDVTNGNDAAAANGIRFNDWNQDFIQNVVGSNSTSSEDGDAFGNLASSETPSTNPNNAQSWYPGGSTNSNSLSWNPTPTSISNGDNTVTLDYSIDQNGVVLVQLYDSNWNYLGQVYENVSAGTSQVTLTLAASGLSAGDYLLQAELRNSSWGSIDVDKLRQEVPFSGGTPPTGGNSLSWNPTPTNISNGDNTVTLDYSIDQAGLVLIQLYDSNWNYLGQVYDNVSAGTGTSTLTLPASGLSAGDYLVQAELRNSSWGGIDVDRLREWVPFSGAPTGGNSLSWNPTPTSISNGNNQITLDYSIDQSGILLLQVYDANWSYIGQVYENVSAGARQSTLTLAASGLSANNNNLQAKLLNSGWGDIGVPRLHEQLPNSNNKIVSDISQNIQLSPNPANHSIQLACELSENVQAQIQIHDAFGKLVKRITDVEIIAGLPTSLEVSQFPAGVYFCTLQSDEWQAVKKFVIAR